MVFWKINSTITLVIKKSWLMFRNNVEDLMIRVWTIPNIY